jgi:O-antigen ligase/polysaccharide polymerase Wzy-like membrane protein
VSARRRLLWPAAGLLAALGAAVAVSPTRLGLLAAAALAASVGLVLLERPTAVLVGVLVATVLFESERQSLVPAASDFYRGPPSALDLLLAVVVLGLVLHAASGRATIYLPGSFTLPLVVLATAACAGTAAGYLGGADRTALVIDLRGVVYLVLLPILVVSLLGSGEAVRLAVVVGAVLAGVKGIEGLVSWLVGAGRSIEGTTLTFYAPGANFFLMVFVSAVLAALVMRVPLPLWTKLAAVLAFAVIILSFRRSFWIALPLSLLAALVIASGARLRLLVVPGLAVLGLSAFLAVTTYGGPQLSGPVGKRFQSLNPTSLRADRYDRYRIDEAANVREELRRHPLTGLGLGVPWQERHPLPVELDGGHYYTHVVAFWFWLKLGLAGVIAYVWLMVAAIAAGLRIWRRHPEPIVRVAGVAVAAALPALAVAETTASFTGADPRFSVLMGALFGWLAAAAAQAHRDESP